MTRTTGIEIGRWHIHPQEYTHLVSDYKLIFQCIPIIIHVEVLKIHINFSQKIPKISGEGAQTLTFKCPLPYIQFMAAPLTQTVREMTVSVRPALWLACSRCGRLAGDWWCALSTLQ